MSQLNVDQRSVENLLSDKKNEFLIPDYQRPYAWDETRCKTLWDDFFEFCIPNQNKDAFHSTEEYFLGPVVVFKNEKGQLEIIDGQQRLTSTLLLLRAFYDCFAAAQDGNNKKTRERIAKCIWKTDEFGNPDESQLKILSEVATDDEKEEFLSILKTGEINDQMKSRYAKNFKLFKESIRSFIQKFPDYTATFAVRILNNVIFLPIEAQSQETALRIFSTLNDRGLPLSDSDIFKSQFYKYFSLQNKKDIFIKRWKDLEEKSKQIETSMDELFTRYMYYIRAKNNVSKTTMKSLRDFYSENNYAFLKNEQTLEDLEFLLECWYRIIREPEDLNKNLLAQLFILNYSTNSMWVYLLSIYLLVNKKSNSFENIVVFLNREKTLDFLKRVAVFTLAYTLDGKDASSFRTPLIAESINLVKDLPVTFSKYQFGLNEITNRVKDFEFKNSRPVTKFILAWWVFQNQEQESLDIESKWDIEHIYAKKIDEINPLKNAKNLECLGNKSLLEKRINIRASDYQFENKKKYYQGFGKRLGTKVRELFNLSQNKTDFNEEDIEKRNEEIIHCFINSLKEFNLIKP